MIVKENRRIILYIAYVLSGTILWGLGAAEIVEEFWSGIGAGLLGVGVVRLLQARRFLKDAAYRERVEVEVGDERNRFLRNKAWAWAGYLFILIVGSGVIVLKIAGLDLWSLAASYAVCLMLLLYWGAYAVLRKKY